MEASLTPPKPSNALKKINFLMVQALVVSLLGWLSAVAANAGDGETVSTFLNVYCADCHGKTKPEAGLRLDNLSADFADPTGIDDVLVDVWQRVHEQITLGVMPPVDSTQLPAGVAEQVTGWITSQLQAVGQKPSVWHKLNSPQFGNYVSHERLFDGTQHGVGSSPPRLWRLSPYVYDEFVNGFGRHLREVTAIHQPFPLDASRGEIADFSNQQVAGEATLQLLMMNCRTLAEYQTTGVTFRDHEAKQRKANRTPSEFDVILGSPELPTDEILRAAITFEFDLLLERAPTETEYESLTDLFGRAATAGGNVKALQTTLQAILMKPEAVYRMEIGLGALDNDGRRRLSPTELAFAIARALTDTGPSEIEVGVRDSETKTTLLNLALSGGLDDPVDIQRTVLQILDDNNMSTADYRMFTQDHGIRNTRTLRFFREFFGYHHAPQCVQGCETHWVRRSLSDTTNG